MEGICVCMDYWTGTQCNVPNCVNNGTLDKSSKVCRCPEGYDGKACQYGE